MPRIIQEQNRVVRNESIELLEHWAIALSGLALLVSGLFELPMAARFGITKLPGLGWSGDFIVSLHIHYIASVIFVTASFFHLLYHGLLGEHGLLPRKGDLKASVDVVKSFLGFGEEPPFGKYLPEQRVAYLGMAVVIGMLIATGLVKTYKNIYAPDLSQTLVFWATMLHNLFFVLFLLAFVGHIGALVLKPNRPLVRGMLTGKVRLDYARHRHPLWLAGGEPPVPLPEAAAKQERSAVAEGMAEELSAPPPASTDGAPPDGEAAGSPAPVRSEAGDGIGPDGAEGSGAAADQEREQPANGPERKPQPGG